MPIDPDERGKFHRIADDQDSPFIGTELVQVAKRIVALRRARSPIFDAALFGEPGWDILLDLYISHHAGKRVSVSGACIASGAPSTTALRWLANLERQRLIDRVNDIHDSRRIFVRLSVDGEKDLKAYLQQAASILGYASPFQW